MPKGWRTGGTSTESIAPASPTVDRMTVRTGEQAVVVDSPVVAGRHADVTDQYTDLEARLHSNIALRDRLQQLLTRAGTLDEVLKLEKEIARIQTDIDALQARIDQLRSRATLASLAVSLERRRVLGPLAQAGNGVVWAVSKLFVIR